MATTVVSNTAPTLKLELKDGETVLHSGVLSLVNLGGLAQVRWSLDGASATTVLQVGLSNSGGKLNGHLVACDPAQVNTDQNGHIVAG